MYEYEISVHVIPDYDITATDVSEIEMEVESGHLYPDYSGPYSVDAAMYDQTLPTQYKNMTGDIVVNAIEEVNGVVTLPTAEGEAKYIDINDKTGAIIQQYHEEEAFSVGITAIQAGNGDPSPSNIRPISGWTGANIYVRGINLFDGEVEEGYISVSTGTNEPAATRYRCKNYIPVTPNARYYLIRPVSAAATRLYYYDQNKNFLSASPSSVQTDGVFAIPANCYYLRFFVNNAISNYNNDISINYPSTDTNRHAYQGNTYNIDWTDAAGTIYGGTLDATLGKLIVTHANIASYNGEELPGEWICDRAVYAPNTTPPTGSQVVYDLAVPLEYDIDPTTISLLIGQNNVYADCGDITVTWATP